MTTHTPQNTRGAAAQPPIDTPLFTGRPPQVGQAPVVFSPEQFKVFMDTMSPQSPAAGAVAPAAAVAEKLPTFWVHDPDLWFLQTEAVFNTQIPKVTKDSTKFDHVVMALPPEALNECKAIIRQPATNNDRYAQLKEALLLNYGKTVGQKHIELIQYAAAKEPVLDVKPSNMLLHIRDLAGDSRGAFERAVLLNRLPKSVRTTLSTSTAPDNHTLALEANQVMEAFLLAHPGCTPASIMMMESAGTAVPDPPEVAAVAPAKRSDAAFLCYIHARYGEKAFSCKSPRCPMNHLVKKKPQQASGNGRAGR